MAGEEASSQQQQMQSSHPPPPQQQSAPAAAHPPPIDDDKDSESDDGDAAEEILEESPCRRWSKRREQVKQRDVPGIDFAYLAMDNETGNEVVWNEVQFSERKNFRAQEEKINVVFDNLTQLVHTNLVKFHKYWTDAKSEKPRIIFITEYMSSGSMSLFLQRTRKSGSPLSVKAWKKWTTQILSALNYLHSSQPPIIHGNLTCNTVFIQQNGLIKIGSVAPDAINHHVKTCRENIRNMHYIAPEFESCTELTAAADIYSFGICALEIAVTGGLSGCQNGGEGPVTPEAIEKGLRSIDDAMQRDFIESCLRKDPAQRPTARQLLFHPVLFEVHSLKLLSAHMIVDSKMYDDLSDSVFRVPDNEKVAAVSRLREMAYCQVPAFQLDLEKFLEDVRNGIYPLTAFAPLAHAPSKMAETLPDVPSGSQPSRKASGEQRPATAGKAKSTASSASPAPVGHGAGAAGSANPSQPEPAPSPPAPPPPEEHKESRSILRIKAVVNRGEMVMLLELDDLMRRQLTTKVVDEDSAASLAGDLVKHGFICEADESRVRSALCWAWEESESRRLREEEEERRRDDERVESNGGGGSGGGGGPAPAVRQ